MRERMRSSRSPGGGAPVRPRARPFALLISIACSLPAVLVLWFAAPAPALAISPHVSYAPTDTITSVRGVCGACHRLHEAPVARGLLAVETAEQVTAMVVCYTCHAGNGSRTNVKNGAANSFAGASGHVLEQSGVDLTDACTSCHATHRDWETVPRIPRAVINGAEVAGADNSWCLACHNATADWFVSVTGEPYPAGGAIVRDGRGYPVSGAFRGPDAFAAGTHASIPASEVPSPMAPGAGWTVSRTTGDCLWCHASHRGVSEYDSLVAPFAPSTPATVELDRTRGDYAALCFGCHDGSRYGVADIKRVVTSGGPRAGHRITTSGGTLPSGAPMPCYDCHNPMGSSRGNTRLISDALGGNLDPRRGVGSAAAAGVRAFCFTCHTTSDMVPLGWDSGAGVLTALAGQGSFEGLRRDGVLEPGQGRTDGKTANELRLSARPGHAALDTQDCNDCHGDVHDPMAGPSLGGQGCLGCHTVYAGMVADTGSYHHVLDASVPDFAPGASEYPTSTVDLSCVSCHVDHGRAGGSRAANLRTSVDDTSGVAVATDFIAPGEAGAPGVCVSCHAVALDRDTARQAAGVTPATVVPSVDATRYAGSAHRYQVTSTFSDGSTFAGDCAKCHDDDGPAAFQLGGVDPLTGNPAPRFGLHLSTEQRLVSALGGAIVPLQEEAACFRCHSAPGDGVGGSAKWLDGYDWFGVKPMSPASERIYALVSSAYGHGVGRYSGLHATGAADETQADIAANKHVECGDCHDLHATGPGRHVAGTSNAVSDAIRGVTGLAFSPLATFNWQADSALIDRFTRVAEASYEYEICFKCHSSGNPAYAEWGGSLPGAPGVPAWTNVAREFNTGNQSYHPVVGALPTADPSGAYGSSRVAAGRVSGVWGEGATMYCSDCHGDAAGVTRGPHGSSVRYTLRGPRTDWPERGDAGHAGEPITLAAVAGGYAGTFCANCHDLLANPVHARVQHRPAACVNCHVTVPHGAGQSRLIGDSDGAMPSRYAYRGDAATMYVRSFVKQSDPAAYTQAHCAVTGAATGCSSAGHSTTALGATGANW